MLDLIAYALLKSKISEAATGIQGAEIKEGELVFTLSDGSIVSAGKLWDENSSPITNVKFENSALIIEHLSGKKETLNLPQSDIKGVELQGTNLIFTFFDNTQLVAPLSGKQITAAEIKNNHLIFTFSDSSTLDAGELLVSSIGIDDTKVSSSTTYSSEKIQDIINFELICCGDSIGVNSSLENLIPDATSRQW